MNLFSINGDVTCFIVVGLCGNSVLSDYDMDASGGSRISRSGGVDLRRGHFSVKMYAKTKELGPIGGGACPAHAPPLDPPMDAWINIVIQT